MYQKSREEIIQKQQREVLELSTPVVKLWDGILALPLIGTLDSERTQIVMESLLQSIVETGAAIAIIDITGVPTVDTLVAQHLLKTVAAARLMGAECIISGIRPQIAATIVHLGVELEQRDHQGHPRRCVCAGLEAYRPDHSARCARIRRRRPAVERIPILKMGEFLLVSIQVDMHDRLAMTLQDDLTERIVKTHAHGRADRYLLARRGGFVHRPDARPYRGHVPHPGCRDGGGRHASGGGDYAGGTGSFAARHPHGAERRKGNGPAAPGQRRPRTSSGETGHGPAAGLRRCPSVRMPMWCMVRQQVRAWAVEQGFGLVDQTKIVTAASELARNTLIYGGGGSMRLEALNDGMRKGLRLTFEDHGPGIADIELAMKDGYTTGTGLGLGLSGAKRLSNEFEIHSKVGRGDPGLDHPMEVDRTQEARLDDTCIEIREQTDVAEVRRAAQSMALGAFLR